MECRESGLIKPKLSGKWFKAVANIRTVPVKYGSDIQSAWVICVLRHQTIILALWYLVKQLHNEICCHYGDQMFYLPSFSFSASLVFSIHSLLYLCLQSAWEIDKLASEKKLYNCNVMHCLHPPSCPSTAARQSQARQCRVLYPFSKFSRLIL